MTAPAPRTGPVRAGPVRALRAEALKTLSVKTWWALLIPAALVALMINLFGGLFSAAIGGVSRDVPGVLLASLAYALALTSVFAGLHGVVLATAEFRHRTATTTYLLAGRAPTLLAKAASAAVVGAGYALVAAVVGAVGGLLGQGGGRLPSVGSLLAVAATGVAVCALWGVLGVALGTLLTNQVGAIVVLLGYVLAVENLLSMALRSGLDDGVDSGRSPGAVARLTSYLPANAGDVALYDLPARELGGRYSTAVVEGLAGVSAPPPGWGALLVLLVWAAAGVALAWVAGGRRDVT
ncbi:hypothetical protein GCM10009836_65780 [Pseudonocardia ailaonensis]|uniref:ABC transporter permease n=1 Tax=Pseudonocardia ailaonensis TaxID=367279 RepID=A0ABN2NMU2_9PSEU